MKPPPPSAPGAIDERDRVQAMFGRIVPRYDLMNRLMTAGQDTRWRRLAIRQVIGARPPATLRLLDLATGTGDLALGLAAAGAGQVIGLDFAAPMIARATQKRAARPPADQDRVAFVVGDALALPFADAAFDGCTVSFGLRNMADYEAALREFARVLRPDGRFVCLEMTPFTAPVAGAAFNWYFRQVMPLVGGWLSGDRAAYAYLPRSVRAFPPAPVLTTMLRDAGFRHASHQLLGGGTVALHLGVR